MTGNEMLDGTLDGEGGPPLLAGFTHSIDGAGMDSDTSFEVIDPATGRPFALCPDASPAQLDAAVASARTAQPAWGALSYAARRDALHRLADEWRAHREPLARLLVREQGKPLMQAVAEIDRAAGVLEALACIELGTEVLRDDALAYSELHYRPLGVVGAITPWNFPVVLAAPKIAQALYAGNTLILKPSPYTPLTTLELGRLARRVLPAGVLNVLAGGNDLGRWMTEHAGIAKISFTGSGPTGKRVMAGASGTLKRITLELGGNDAAIVLEDADVDEIAPKLFRAAFHNSGQICMAIKRLYVHDALYEPMCRALTALAQRARLGGGFEEGVELGPIQNQAQFEIVKDILDDTARQPGARILAGGRALDRPGYFVPPTIVAGLAEGARLVDEEPFGPVLPVIRFSDERDAIARANATRFGLGGSIWTSDVERGARLAATLECGTAWVNQHAETDPGAPFGGIKESGVGREFAVAGLKGYMEAQVLRRPPRAVAQGG